MAYLPVLYRIQEIRNQLEIIKKSVEKVHQNPVVIDLKNKNVKNRRSLAEIEAKQISNQKEQQRQGLELKSCLEKLKHEESKLYDGSVVNARELEQIQQKAAEYHNLKSQLEDDLIKLMEDEEVLANLKKQLIQDQESCKQDLVQLERESEQKFFELNLESTELNSELNSILPLVPNEWLEKLDKIAHPRNGIGIARIKQGCCGVCHVSLSESLFQKAKRGEDLILLCENCGRIIFY